MNKTTESYEALKLKCTLLEIQNEKVRHEVREAREEIIALGKAHEHFLTHISDIKNYKKWVTDLTLKDNVA